MKVLKNEMVENKITEKIFCNICGKETKKDKFGYYEDYVDISKVWGYNSNKDGQETRIDICEECFDKIIENCKIKP